MVQKDVHLRDQEIYLDLTETIGNNPEKGYLLAYKFNICLLNGKKVGKCEFRIMNDTYVNLLGNIGYLIEEEYRGNHFAAKACRLLFSLAKSHDMNQIIIACAPENIASVRTIELAGGTFVDTCDIPEAYHLYKKGIRKVIVYRVEL